MRVLTDSLEFAAKRAARLHGARVIGLAVLLTFNSGMGAAPAMPAPSIQRIPKPDSSGTAWSVRVADAPLVFTGQIASTTRGKDAAADVAGALEALKATLIAGSSELSRVVRLTAYVANDAAVAAVDTAVAREFARNPAALTVIRTPLSAGFGTVAFEAVATTTRAPTAVEIINQSVAVLPAGGKIFISGQADRGTDLATAVRLTMAGLLRSVAHLGLKKTDIVQVKAFIKPFSDYAAAAREVATSFDGELTPPFVAMEWESDLFAEIEIVVSARTVSDPAGEPISYSWFPWLTKSPRYSHVGFVAAGTPLIFVGAIDGGETGNARAQMKTIFERLGSVLFEAGSSYRNLAKATYYLADPAARTVLGDIRGVYFDPTRPPAASALQVNSLGRTSRSAMVDMVAVPVK